MADAITDEMLEHFAVVCPWDDLADRLRTATATSPPASSCTRLRRSSPAVADDRRPARGEVAPVSVAERQPGVAARHATWLTLAHGDPEDRDRSGRRRPRRRAAGPPRPPLRPLRRRRPAAGLAARRLPARPARPRQHVRPARRRGRAARRDRHDLADLLDDQADHRRRRAGAVGAGRVRAQRPGPPVHPVVRRDCASGAAARRCARRPSRSPRTCGCGTCSATPAG